MHCDSSIDGKNEVKLTTGTKIQGNAERMIEERTIEICQQEGKTKRGSSTAEDLEAGGLGATGNLRAGGIIGMRKDQETAGERTTRPDQETGGTGTRKGQRTNPVATDRISIMIVRLRCVGHTMIVETMVDMTGEIGTSH